jgi:hypothetical protein
VLSVDDDIIFRANSNRRITDNALGNTEKYSSSPYLLEDILRSNVTNGKDRE